VKKQRDLERHSFWKAGEDLSQSHRVPCRCRSGQAIMSVFNRLEGEDISVVRLQSRRSLIAKTNGDHYSEKPGVL
jgi:hypothetical protein